MFQLPPLNFAGGTSTSGAPVATGPVSVNVAGFGGRASGSASLNATQDQGFPAAGAGVGFGAMPAWVIPAMFAAIALALIVRK